MKNNTLLELGDMSVGLRTLAIVTERRVQLSYFQSTNFPRKGKNQTLTTHLLL